MIFSRDPNKVKRTATSLSWHPLDYHKLAVAYSCLEFQRAPKNMSFDSYIWNIGMLYTVSLMILFMYLVNIYFFLHLQKFVINQRWLWNLYLRLFVWSTTTKILTSLLGEATMDRSVGFLLWILIAYEWLYRQIYLFPSIRHTCAQRWVHKCSNVREFALFPGYWDTRCGSQPVQMSATEHSHKDPVYKVIWLQTKIGNETFSASTDGQVCVQWQNIQISHQFSQNGSIYQQTFQISQIKYYIQRGIYLTPGTVLGHS